MQRRVEITIEKHERTILRGLRERRVSWCRQCTQESVLLRPEEAAVTAGVTVRTVNRWVEADVVHFDETPDGRLLICANSVSEIVPACRD
jgi:hypothetical protein